MLEGVSSQGRFKVEVVDIEQNPVLDKLFGEHIPVLEIERDRRLYWPFGPEDVLGALNGGMGLELKAGAAEAAARPAVTGRTRDLVIFLDRLIYGLARRWVAMVAVFLGVYAGLPLLAPILMASGYNVPSNLIYSAYRFACHQLPSRSYFIFGHQVAFCHRDTAIYVSLFLVTILFGFIRRRVKPLPWQGYVAFLIPMAVDGITQLVGLRTSNWQLRSITGALFGIGSAWLALPYLEEAFRDIRESVAGKLDLD
jgi:uncharacterized membrane protein